MKINFGSDWTFTKDSTSLHWEKITIPHTAQIEPLVVNNQWQGDCWYQKQFDVEKIENEKIFLNFEGVMHEAWVWINGKLVIHHQGGYLPFTIDATDWVKEKDNTIIVKVNNEDNPQIPPGKTLKTLDFNYYGGIYRNVYLIKTNTVYITDAVHTNQVNGGGILVHFDEISPEKASGFIKVHVKNESNEPKNVKLDITFSNPNHTSTFTSKEVVIGSNAEESIVTLLEIKHPELWGIEQPNLYDVEVKVLSEKSVLDRQTLKTGIRKAKIKKRWILFE
ncbi:hypothetical protein H9X57_07730 [Flavobacterium piscinae]|uniref:glycoside hydrolase family 2 protein n=1 Tax=Flavobacterium piscinae TaxID=2506424 RepID=UPI0019879017|nr:sugar-binding domain-containing protein [Flavobacterium piscinae]MBC8883365.1 hypothetical protein [Flavobacterium piscinae]